MTLEDHYNLGAERERLLRNDGHRVEFVRTLDVLDRHLPPPPARVLDVGGGPGEYAVALRGRGYDVFLVDVTPLHVEQARGRGIAARVGDARAVDEQDASADAVLLLGPLYHLPERDDRVRALREAARVVRPGGVVAAAAISRYASFLDGFVVDGIRDGDFVDALRTTLTTGRHENPRGADRPGWFTTAHFHTPEELRGELDDAGLALDALVGVEGPAWIAERVHDVRADATMLELLRRLESEPVALATSLHLLAVARPV